MGCPRHGSMALFVLYVNLSEIDDAQFKVSKADNDLNRKFYGEQL